MISYLLWGLLVILLSIIIGSIIINCEIYLLENFASSCVDYIPYKSLDNKTKKHNTIFVSVASYRDNECSITIQSLFEKASNPSNIYVGICEQNKKDVLDEICIGPLVKKFSDNIRIFNIDYTNAKGPTYARYYCSKLWDGEEYYLQIDSHTTFTDNWDSKLISMIKNIKENPEESNYPVLSVYPPTNEQMNIEGVPEMDNGKISDNDLPIFYCGWTNNNISKPLRSNKPWAAAGFMFLESDFLKNVPFDPNLSHLFQGEECLFSARLFTNGYDFYTPNEKIAYHHYSRNGPMYHKDIKESSECRAKAEKRCKFLLGIGTKESIVSEFLKDLNYYGLGNVRTINDFWNASGINIKSKIVEKWNDNNVPSNNYDGWWFRRDGYQLIKKTS